MDYEHEDEKITSESHGYTVMSRIDNEETSTFAIRKKPLLNLKSIAKRGYQLGSYGKESCANFKPHL